MDQHPLVTAANQTSDLFTCHWIGQICAYTFHMRRFAGRSIEEQTILFLPSGTSNTTLSGELRRVLGRLMMHDALSGGIQ